MSRYKSGNIDKDKHMTLSHPLFIIFKIFMWSRIRSQIFTPTNSLDSLLKWTVSILEFSRWKSLLRLWYRFFLNLKYPFIINEESLIFNLYISIVRYCKFFRWIVTDIFRSMYSNWIATICLTYLLIFHIHILRYSTKA